MLKLYTHRGISIHSSLDLAEASRELVTQAFAQLPKLSSNALSGRREVQRLQLPEAGALVVKHYTRGGVIGKLLSTYHYRVGSGTRAAKEFEMLLEVRKLGVNAAEPVAWAVKGGWRYRNWLVTREIERSSTLLELAIESQPKALLVIDEMLRQIAVLIENGFLHIDLHPGNVLVTEDQNVFFVDFDKAKRSRAPKNELRDFYLHRWRRAIIKHSLPEFLAETVSMGLRRRFS